MVSMGKIFKKRTKKIGLQFLKKRPKQKRTRKLFKSSSIGNRISISTIIVLVCIVFIQTSISYIISERRLIKSAKNLLLHKATDTATIVDNQIRSYNKNLEILGHLSSISNPNVPVEEKFEILKSEKERLGLSSIGLVDLEGNLVLDSLVESNIKGTKYFERAKQGDTYFSQPIRNSFTGKNEVVISSPLVYNGEIVGVILGYKSADELYGIVENIVIGETGVAYILNEVVDIIAHPTIIGSSTENADYYHAPINFSALEQRIDESSKVEIDEIYGNIRKGQNGSGKYVSEGKSIHIGYAPIKSKNWTLVVTIDEAEVLKELDSLKNLTVIILAFAIILGSVFALIISKSITKPINLVTDYCNKLSELDLSSNISEKALKRKDELGKMASSIQIVVDNLRNIVKEIRDSSIQVASSSEELAAISEESTAAATSIAENSNDIAENSQKQLEEILNISSSINEISTQMNYVSNQIHDAESNSKNVFEKTNLGKEKIDDVITQMANIENSTHSVKISLNDITLSSSKMNQMLEIIESIAEQTNLLALNAAIEAARAGEYGRGFAVVADEIRKLAEETRKSTEEIYGIIESNNQLIEEANKKMDLNSEEVEAGVIGVNEAKKAFDEIASSILQIAVSIKEVAAAVSNVEGHMTSLTESSGTIENMSKNISAQIQNASGASQEQMASMEEIASSTENLASLAEGLEALVQNIKL